MINKGDKLVPMAGGLARAAKLTPEQRSAIARKARAARTANYDAKHPNALHVLVRQHKNKQSQNQPTRPEQTG